MTFRSGKIGAVDHLVGVLFAIAYLACLLGTARDVGFARDEGFYFTAADSYLKWFDTLFEDPKQAVEEETIDQRWKYNSEHPALMKTLFGFSNRIFQNKLDWLSPATSYRLPGMLMAALAVYILFIWGSLAFNRAAGAFAAIAFALMPRVFYHSHLACFDIPITTMWLLVTYLYWRSLSSFKFGIATGLAYGVALCVKLNAFFMPLVLGAHYLAVVGYWWLNKGKGSQQNSVFPKPWAFLSGAIFAPLIFYAHWPWLWYHTSYRLSAYMGFHSSHVHYNTAWFGENIIQAPTPLLFPTVMTLMTVPTAIVALSIAGSLLRMHRHLPAKLEDFFGRPTERDGVFVGQGLDLLLFLSAVFPIALISHPSIPVFGGTKHWMPSFPFISILAGVAAARLGSIAASFVPRANPSVVRFAVVAVLLVPPLQQTVKSHPFGLASYVPLVGGAPGAATLGMTRQFWGYTTAGVIPWLNVHVKKGETVDFHDTAQPSIRMFAREGLLRSDIRSSDLKRASFALMHHELHMIRNEAWIWNAFGTFVPSHVLLYQGVPIVSVYERPRRSGDKAHN